MAHPHYDVIIYGAGHAGCCLAARIGSFPHMRVLLISPSWQLPYKSGSAPSRLFAISAGSLALLPQDAIIKGQLINHILVYEEGSAEELHFSPEEIDCSNFGMMVQEEELHHAVQSVMPDSVEKVNGSVHQVDSQQALTSITLLDGRRFSCALLVAADGKLSELRGKVDGRVYFHDYRQFGLVCEVSHLNDHAGLAVEKFMPSGPFAVLPRCGGFSSSVVWTISQQQHKDFIAMDTDAQQRLIAFQFPKFYQEVRLISDVQFFPLTMQLLESCPQGRIAFIGDAAHSIHPLAGQGFNLTLRGIDLLTNMLCRQSRLGLDLGCPVMLKDYQKQRRVDAQLMSESMHFLNGFFSHTHPVASVVRSWGLRWFARSPCLKKWCMRYAIGH